MLRELDVYRWRMVSESIEFGARLTGFYTGTFAGPDLGPLRNLSELRTLSLKDYPRLVSLAGIADLVNLRDLTIGADRRFTDIAPIAGAPWLERLWFGACRGIGSISPLSAVKSLRWLYLDDCGDVESLTPLAHLDALEDVSFVGDTKVLDGKIAMLAELPRLRDSWFQNRRFYDITREALRERLEANERDRAARGGP